MDSWWIHRFGRFSFICVEFALKIKLALNDGDKYCTEPLGKLVVDYLSTCYTALTFTRQQKERSDKRVI